MTGVSRGTEHRWFHAGRAVLGQEVTWYRQSWLKFLGIGMWRVRTIKESDRQDLVRIFAVDDPYPEQGM